MSWHAADRRAISARPRSVASATAARVEQALFFVDLAPAAP